MSDPRMIPVIHGDSLGKIIRFRETRERSHSYLVHCDNFWFNGSDSVRIETIVQIRRAIER